MQQAYESQAELKNYVRFIAMILTSSVAMLALTYANTYAFGHVYWSETRFYMATMMGAAMAIVMLSFMWNMHRNGAANVSIYVGSAAIITLSVWLVRSQTSVQDVSYMKAMIPHHSIAILTSERAEISDPRVRELADGIIETQKREIALMKSLIEDLQSN